ncbi:MAG: glutamate 5-kinase [Clostridiales bacterium]|nr:glutamate 5-kinase [Clostridiales bacterium]
MSDRNGKKRKGGGTAVGRAAEILKDSRKLVVKIGSNVLANADGHLDRAQIAEIARQTLALMADGRQVILVSSGAGAAGAGATGRLSRRGDITYKQALCAVGQVELMMAYRENFAESGHVVGQLLLTAENFADETNRLNIRNTLFTLLDEGVVPIINENDSVSTRELSFGDNDHLAALTANLWNADLLILMSDVDGVYDCSPKENANAALIEEVDDIEALRRQISTDGASCFGTGGMESKIAAAEEVGAYSIPLLLVNGRRPHVLLDVLHGGRSTIFPNN